MTLPPAARLLTLCRDHWRIENRMHWVRDVTCREDACRTASGNATQRLAALRNTVLTTLRRLGLRPVEGFEHFAENRTQLIDIFKRRRSE